MGDNEHPNRLPFQGLLTLVDVVSDRSPSGARGHRVVLTSAAARRALPSLLGMGIGCTPDMGNHDARCKVGVITNAEITGSELLVSGYIFARDFPEVVAALRGDTGIIRARKGESHDERLAMSYELAEARVEDSGEDVWTITEAIFTGAAILRRNVAAYRGTWIALANAGPGRGSGVRAGE